jgi:hypothetical protein
MKVLRVVEGIDRVPDQEVEVGDVLGYRGSGAENHFHFYPLVSRRVQGHQQRRHKHSSFEKYR